MSTRTDGFHYRTHLLMDMDRSTLHGGGVSSSSSHRPVPGFWLALPDSGNSRRRSVSMAKRSPSRSGRPTKSNDSAVQPLLPSGKLHKSSSVCSLHHRHQHRPDGIDTKNISYESTTPAVAATAAFSLMVGLSAGENYSEKEGLTPLDPPAPARSPPEPPAIRLSPPSTPSSPRDKTIDQDCFIIPANHVDRFMPVPIGEVINRAFDMMQLEDPTVCIVLDFMEDLKPLSPSIPTLVSGPHPLTVHMAALKETVQKVNEVGSALEGMILMNMERDATYPFITYMVVNVSITDPAKFMTQYHSIMVEHFSPAKIQHIGDHHISLPLPTMDHFQHGIEGNWEKVWCDKSCFLLHHAYAVYEEVATIARPPIDILPKKPSNTKTGYIITVFKVFPGDDREKLERSWLMWTGARMAYKYLPKCLGLKRITFHKKLWPNGGITYVLLIECSNLLDFVTEGCWFVEQLRARCCGYTGIYKILDHF